MDLKVRQLWSSEQEVVLETLARAAGRPGCKFLEVGSWCGDSTLVIGSVAREYVGHVFCVDWWKGNVGTELADIAATEDVFAAFWSRMKRAGLEDVVVPIRGSSAVAAQVLAGGTFDLVFLDADHSYNGIRDDIRHYAPLLRRPGGILCGHDCEGRIDDYDCDFLESGKQVDFFQSVHCGVVLAVGQAFRDYSIDHGIWSVRAEEGESWKPTHLTFPEIARRRQPASLPIGYSKSYMLFRYGRLVYAVPSTLAGIDITADDETNRQGLPSAPSLREMEQVIGEKVFTGSGPILVESYQGYNLVRFEERLYALAQRAGPLILPQLSDVELETLQEAGDCVIADSLIEIKRVLDRRPAEQLPEPPPPNIPWDDADPHLVEEGYRGHNIIYFRGAWYGLGQEEGAFEPRKIQDGRYRRCFTGDSADAVRAAIRGERRLYRRIMGVAKKLAGLAHR